MMTSAVLVLSLTVLAAFSQVVSEDKKVPLSEACFECHETEAVGDLELAIIQQLQASVHEGFDCLDCHVDIVGIPHDEELASVDCGSCHSDVAEIYRWHGRVKVGEDVDIPSCADCHGRHSIIPSREKDSRLSPGNLPATCGECHEDINLTTKHEILYGEAITAFKSSVHGRAISGGVMLAAACNDCHSSDGSAHRIYGPADPQSTINHFNIPKTCGRCHSSVEEEYWMGIHGKLVLRGETDAPVCTDCHGEHGIIRHLDPRSPVSPTRVAEATCAPCHESARLNEKYNIPTGRLRTWYDTYHGLKSKAGDVTVANCASCHGAHFIVPQSDIRSSIHPDNLQHTCGECHPGISATLATTPIHTTPAISTTPTAGIARNIYIVAIFVIIGSMLIHWLIDLRKQLQLVRAREQIERMAYNEVWQHTFLMITFVVLVITGFSLRFADSWWVKLLFGWEGGFPLRGIIHRVTAVVFILTAVWHLAYLGSQRGRQFLKDMLPTIKDFKQFFQMIAYNLERTSDRPRFGRFSYVEKAEYWALVWGTAVMIVTGFFLWFDNIAVQWFPKGFLDVMLVIHYYEAWLASLAILIWHMYSTVFSPAVYPMNPAWLTGKMPRDMYYHEHADDPALNEPGESPAENNPDEIEPVESGGSGKLYPQG